jgi:RNA ligase (TIGR02306 family)
MAIKYDLENKLKNYPTPNIAIQGELVGPGIQQNKYKLKEVQLHVFKIWLINERRYANSMERLQMCQDLGLEHVPVLDTITFDFKTVAEVLAYAEGKSKLCPTHEREWVVFKALNGSHSFKAISNKFLLKCEE